VKALALDTTTRAGSVAIVDDDRIVDDRRGDIARPHAERLPGEILTLVAANGIALSEIDLFAVASGPGSFTGLRIGIATMQGLAFVGGRPMVGIPALEALAHLAVRDAQPGALVAAWMDAHRRDVFAALYRVTGAPLFDPGRLVAVEGPTVGDPASTLARWRDMVGEAAPAFIGDGALMFADVIARVLPASSVLSPPPLAGAIGRLAIARARRGETVRPAAMHPLYVRRPDAEVARERAAR
jgi:tRNA threonylcarbamoyladenosine biosynthesis protein TsaB